jgi:curved DNA-binding protein CbpA
LDATDGFLLTRIDGRLASKDLARETGLHEFQVEKTIAKLEKLGVIEHVEPGAPTAAPPPLPPPLRERAKLPEFTSIGAAPRYDARELDEEIDLPQEQKRRILDLYYRLDDMDHYTLLGVGKEANKKTVKRSYFELASLMHPDRYFKKNLGSFKLKMEVLFGRITEAHDTLVDPARRADYDTYLAEVGTTMGMEALLERAMDEARRTADAALAAEATSSASIEPAIVEPEPTVAPRSTVAANERRAALARRLIGTRPPASSAPAPSASPEHPLRYVSTDDAIDALRRRYEERIESATSSQIGKYVTAAEEALAKNDVVAAASSLQIAIRFAPDDTELANRYDELRRQADTILCENYAKQAANEERGQHWPEAARSWQKVAKIRRDDAKAHDRAAYCIFMNPEGDLHQAAEHGRLAVAADASVVGYHTTLADIYLRAEKMASARRAAEAGLAIDPKNAALLAIVKKSTKT